MGYLKFKKTLMTNADFNFTLNGIGFYEIDVATAKNSLDGENLVCAAYIANVSPIKYIHTGYYKNVKKFLKTDDWTGVYILLFRPVKDEKDAEIIIKMLKDEVALNKKA